MALELLDGLLGDTITREEYLSQRKARSYGSFSTLSSTLTNADLFCSTVLKMNLELVLKELRRDIDEKRDFKRTLVFFQKFVDWMFTPHPELKVPANSFGHFEPFRAKSAVSIRNYVGQLRQYCKKVGGFEITAERIADHLVYPVQGEIQDAAPLLHKEFLHIINHVKDKKRHMLYLIKKDTCSRIGAMVQLRKENFNITVRPIAVTFPAHIMKKNKRGMSRTVTKYVTTENEEGILSLLADYKDPRDVVFGTNADYRKALHNEEKFWNKLVKRLGYTDVYRHNGRLKKNIHSIKAFAETQAEEAVDKFYADAYGDHDAYLKQYIRWSEEKKIRKFRLMEPLLNIFTITKTIPNKVLQERNDSLENKISDLEKIVIRISNSSKNETKVNLSEDKKEKILKLLSDNGIL